MVDATKVKPWWSEDGKWFCLLVDDGVNKATVSLTPDEAKALGDALADRAKMTDRERAILALRRGVPLGKVVTCSCFTHPPTRNGCFGVCEDTVAAIVASYEALRADALADSAGTVPSPNEAIAAMVEAWHQDFIGRPLAAHVLGELQRRIATLFQEHRSSPDKEGA